MFHLRASAVISIFQVVLFVSICLWFRSVSYNHIGGRLGQVDFIVAYAITPLHLLMKLNFPLVLLWLPISYPLNYLFSILSPYRSVFITAGVLAFVAAAASVAWFWNFVMIEVHRRKRGDSLIRFSKRSVELLKVAGIATAGITAIAFAVWDGRRLLLLGEVNRWTLYWSSMVDAIVGGLFLAIWAAILIRVAIEDFRAVRRK